MVQELGRIERPATAQYQGKRKLLLVPLLYAPPTEAEEGRAILDKYWEQVRSQISALELRLGQLRRIYHEGLAQGGPDGLKHLEMLDQRSYQLAQTRSQSGTTLEVTEDPELLAEILDLQRFLTLPLASERVARRIHEWFSESNRSRYEFIARQIDATLREHETGLLLINERHQVQFPADIEVFYVAPPALDEFRRWLQGWVAQQQQRPAGPEEDDEGRKTEDQGQ
jgi:hypothetical protein